MVPASQKRPQNQQRKKKKKKREKNKSASALSPTCSCAAGCVNARLAPPFLYLQCAAGYVRACLHPRPRARAQPLCGGTRVASVAFFWALLTALIEYKLGLDLNIYRV